MLLQRLREYSGRTGVADALPPPGYDFVTVNHVLDLSADGRKAHIVTLNDDETKNRRGRRLPMPQTATKTSGIVALPFYGNGQYVLGLVRDPAKAKRAADEHAAFLALVDEYAADGHPDVLAIQEFYRAGGKALVSLPDRFDAADTMALRVNGRFVTELPEVQARWQRRAASGEAPVMQCVSCGQKRPVVRVLEGKVKGIPGGQSGGVALISANAEAFESYGLNSSLIAPTCGDCGSRFTGALNHLLTRERTRTRYKDCVYVYWTRDPDSVLNAFPLITRPTSEQVSTLLESINVGRRTAAPDSDRFYAMALSAFGGRAVVRDWIDVTLSEVAEALVRWFRRMAIADFSTGRPRYFGVAALAGAGLRPDEALPGRVLLPLVRSALLGTPLPGRLLAATIDRCAANAKVTASQASMVKLALSSKREHAQEEGLVVLREDHPNEAYQCGRLLAILHSIQVRAIPNAKSGVVERFFAGASSSPAGIMPRLVRGAQPHLSVVRGGDRPRPGLAARLEQRMEEILDRFPVDDNNRPAFPKALSLDDQGFFMLGYYHERAWSRADAEKRRGAGPSANQN